MAIVQVYQQNDFVVLRSSNAELVILPQFTLELKKLIDKKPFCDFFLNTALVNRSARQLFKSWLRKDQKLWDMIYTSIHTESKTEEPQTP